MNILLINTNPVVSRIISLCMRADIYNLEELSDVSMAKLDNYDILFMDDSSYDPKSKNTIKKLLFSKKIFLSAKENFNDFSENFDEIINKPFLPSQINLLIENFSNEEGNYEEDIEILNTPILNTSEIEKIKALLEDDDNEDETFELEKDNYEARKVEVIKEHLEADGLEILLEDDIADIFSKAEKNKKSKKLKKNKKKKEKETYTFEEALMSAIEGMKVKKIKKLLKGAEVTIKINFKDNK